MLSGAKTIAVINQKGGVGKTTTAVNLAASLAVLENRVLLVELDPQGAVGLCFGLGRKDIRGGMLEVFTQGGTLGEFVISAGRIPVGIVPANVWSDEDEDAYVRAMHPAALDRALASMRPFYDYILIDGPPTIGPMAVAALVAADTYLVPVQCEDLAIQPLGRLLRLARKVGRNQNPRLRLEGLALTMVDGRSRLPARISNTVRRSFGDWVFRTSVPRCVDLARVPARGEPLLYSNASSRGAQAYLRLAGEIIARGATREVSREARKSTSCMTMAT